MESEDDRRIAKAIAFIRQHHLSQPDLITVAQHIGLSEYHFQRLFTQWAGINPYPQAQPSHEDTTPIN